jgi:hypothetical protein
VKEVQPLAKYLRLMVCLDSKTLPRMQPSKTFLERLNEIVVHCHGTAVEMTAPKMCTARATAVVSEIILACIAK